MRNENQHMYFYALGYFDARATKSGVVYRGKATTDDWDLDLAETYYKGYDRGVLDRVWDEKEV